MNIKQRDPNYDISCGCWKCGDVMKFDGKDDYVAFHYNKTRVFAHLRCYLTK